jgi:ribonuclease T1
MRAGTILAIAALALGLAPLPAAAQKAPSQPIAEVTLAELPPEAREALVLIRQGGPYPYAKDGATFGNREGKLPKQKRGYYREYTVKTPGERTRGARRLVTGKGGETYYTADHYNSFRRVRE